MERGLVTNPHRKVATDLRRAIRTAFPGLRFNVTQAGVSPWTDKASAEVEWVDGPTEIVLAAVASAIAQVKTFRSYSAASKSWAAEQLHPCAQHTLGHRAHRCSLLDETMLEPCVHAELGGLTEAESGLARAIGGRIGWAPGR